MQTNQQQVSIPKKLVTGPNCAAVPVKNNFTFPSRKEFKCCEKLVFDLDRCPKHGDLVLLMPSDKQAFIRECYNAPAEQCKKEVWVMGVLDNDDESILCVELGNYEKIGAMTGKVPKQRKIAA